MLQAKTETCVAFSLPFSRCSHSNTEVLLLDNKPCITTLASCGSVSCIIGSVHVVILPNKAPAKGTPGKTTKITAERKEFVWSDNEA